MRLALADKYSGMERQQLIDALNQALQQLQIPLIKGIATVKSLPLSV